MPLSPHRPARKEPAAPEQGGSVPPIKITRVNLTASRFLSPSLWSQPAWPHMGHKHPHLQLAAGDREGQRRAAARMIRAGAGQVSSCDSEHPARPASVRPQRRSINQTPDTSPHDWKTPRPARLSADSPSRAQPPPPLVCREPLRWAPTRGTQMPLPASPSLMGFQMVQAETI